METLQFLSLIFSLFAWTFVCIVLLLLLYRIYSVVIRKKPRQGIGRVEGSVYPKVLKLLFAIAVVLLAVNAWFYVHIVSPFNSFIPGYLPHLLVILITLLSGFELFLGGSISDNLIQKSYKKIVLTVVVAILLPVNIYLIISLPAIFTYPTEDESYLLEVPVRGTWSAGHAGGSTLVNYHQAIQSQQYAIDITKVNERGAFFRDSGMHLTDHFSMGQTVYAPVDGIVVQSVDGLPNTDITFAPADTVYPAGNHVVIQFKEDRYVFLAHLDEGSVLVEATDTVAAGDPIGRVGNSGNTSWPHLHMHIQDKPYLDYENAAGYPFRFREMERKRWFGWRTVTKDYILRNDWFRSLSD